MRVFLALFFFPISCRDCLLSKIPCENDDSTKLSQLKLIKHFYFAPFAVAVLLWKLIHNADFLAKMRIVPGNLGKAASL